MSFNGILTLLTFRSTAKPVVIVLLLLASIVAGFMQRYGVFIDRSMIQNAIETDWGEVRELLSLRLLLSFVLLGVVPSILVACLRVHSRIWYRELGVKLLVLAASAAALACLALAFGAEYASMLRNHRELRFMLTPSNAIQATFSHLKRRTANLAQPSAMVMPDAFRKDSWRTREKPVVLVLVVGETARAVDFSLNGRDRDTNPSLSREQVINYPKVTSCGTSTAVSLPCMFSDLGRERYQERTATSRANLLDVVARADIDVLWRDNNSGCKGICARVTSENLASANVAGLCVDGECFDEILAHDLQARLNGARKPQLIVLHQKGSHGPVYFRRYPPHFEVFRPACNSVDLAQCTPETIHNAYDNTILYTDYVLSKVIGILKQNATQIDSALLYVSDHGESLGEFGLYLHGAPRAIAPAVQYEIPMLAWFSDGFATSMGLDVSCVRTKATASYSHDNLFHSVTGLLDIETTLYRPQQDIFRACRRQATP